MSMLDFAKKEEDQQGFIYTDAQLMSRLKFFIGICLALTLTGIVFVVLYSIIFVTQPLNAISPIDQKFFELIVPIATFLTGTLSGIMLAGNNPDAQKEALKAANKGWDKPPTPAATTPTAPKPMTPPMPSMPMAPRPMGMGMPMGMTSPAVVPMGMGMPTPPAMPEFDLHPDDPQTRNTRND